MSAATGVAADAAGRFLAYLHKYRRWLRSQHPASSRIGLYRGLRATRQKYWTLPGPVFGPLILKRFFAA